MGIEGDETRAAVVPATVAAALCRPVFLRSARQPVRGELREPQRDNAFHRSTPRARTGFRRRTACRNGCAATRRASAAAPTSVRPGVEAEGAEMIRQRVTHTLCGGRGLRAQQQGAGTPFFSAASDRRRPAVGSVARVSPSTAAMPGQRSPSSIAQKTILVASRRDHQQARRIEPGRQGRARRVGHRRAPEAGDTTGSCPAPQRSGRADGRRSPGSAVVRQPRDRKGRGRPRSRAGRRSAARLRAAGRRWPEFPAARAARPLLWRCWPARAGAPSRAGPPAPTRPHRWPQRPGNRRSKSTRGNDRHRPLGSG